MNKYVCRYAVVQFVPYRETGEFANVGVVLMCPRTGFFDYRLQTRKHKRVTDFFEELPREVYLRALHVMKGELDRVALVMRDTATHDDGAEALRRLFDGLTHPREALVRFSATRAVLTDNPGLELARQFDHYVDRAFATPEYIEQTIEKRLRVLLGSLDLRQPFRPARIGDEEFYAKFQLVQQRGDGFAKVIKPFNLGQRDSTAIYEHGDTWVQKIRRLRSRSLLPHDVLFAVAGPPASDEVRQGAFIAICSDLATQDVIIVGDKDDERIAEFASS